MSNFDGKCFNCGAYMRAIGVGEWECDNCTNLHYEYAVLPPEAYMEIIDTPPAKNFSFLETRGLYLIIGSRGGGGTLDAKAAIEAAEIAGGYITLQAAILIEIETGGEYVFNEETRHLTHEGNDLIKLFWDDDRRLSDLETLQKRADGWRAVYRAGGKSE